MTTTRPYVVRDAVDLISVTSTLTGRTIGVNPLPNQFLLHPMWDASGVTQAQRQFEAMIQSSKAEFVARSRLATQRLFATATREAFADELEVLIARMRWTTWSDTKSVRQAEPVNPDNRMKPSKGTDVPNLEHCALLLSALWRNGLILFPRAEAAWPRTLRGRAYAPVASLALPDGVNKEIVASLKGLAVGDERRSRVALVLWVMAASGVQSLADIDESALRLMPSDGQVRYDLRLWFSFLSAMHRAHKIACANNPARLQSIPASYRHIRPKHVHGNDQGRADPSFRWIDNEVPRFAAWRPVLEAYIKALSGRMSTVGDVRYLGTMLTRLFYHPDTTPDPLGMCEDAPTSARAIQVLLLNGQAVGSHARRRIAILRAFFDFVIEQSVPPGGQPDPRYHNPIAGIKLRGRPRPAQTHRDPIPNRLMREIGDVLLDPSETWARSLEADYFLHVDPVSGATERVFSPVRLEFFRLRLLLPLRSFQTRLLDSGEGDSERWEGTDPQDPRVGKWIPNTDVWAPRRGEPKRANGFLRRIYDPEASRELVGLYISTNKSADRAASFAAPGYEIPFESAEIIALANRLRHFQETYNPSKGPQKRSVLETPGTVPADVEAQLPGLHFLFRDTAARRGDPALPVSVPRIQDFWSRLLAHIEQRLKERHAAGDPRGWERPPTLITRWEHNTPKQAAYDLHTLRVTGITELHLGGCPLPVIQMLAGHATFLMTAHYIKYSPGQFTRALNDAMANADERALDGATWEDMAAAGALDAMRELHVANSDDVFERYKGTRDSWQQMDYGECLAGGTLCDSGGEVLVKNKRDGHEYAPVKGGTRNCTSCRFFATGPYAIGGLIARLNATSLKVRIAGERLRTAEKLRRDTIVNAQSATERTPLQIRAEQRRLERVEAALEEAFEEVKLVSAIWQSTWDLLLRSEALLPKVLESTGPDGPASTTKLPMVAVGSPDDVRIALDRCTEFDLTTRICEDWDFYHSADATDASLRRAIRLDRVLAEAGRGAVFATLSPEHSIIVGNAYAKMLRTKLGHAELNDVVEGRKTLAAAGVLEESDRLLAQYRSTAVAPSLAGHEDAQRLLPAAT